MSSRSKFTVKLGGVGGGGGGECALYSIPLDLPLPLASVEKTVMHKQNSSFDHVSNSRSRKEL